MNEPQPPTSLPKYLQEGLPNQDNAALQDIRDYIDELLEYRQREIKPDDIPDDADVVDDSGGSKGAIITRKNTCGDRSCHCYDGEKHGPYKYRVFRNDQGDVEHEYLGKV